MKPKRPSRPFVNLGLCLLALALGSLGVYKGATMMGKSWAQVMVPIPTP